MNPDELIKRAQAAGAQFAPGPTGVRVTWPAGVDPALKAQILANKDAVKATWLKSQQPGIAARASGMIESGLGAAAKQVSRVPYVGKPVSSLMPKTTPELMGQVGATVGSAVAPEYALAEWGLPIVGGMLGGAGGAKLKGESAKSGAATGGIIGLTGKAGETLLSKGVEGAQLMARTPAAKRAADDVARIGSWIEQRLPNAARSVGGDVKTLEGFDTAIRDKGLTDATGKAVGDFQKKVITTLNDPVINVPALSKSPVPNPANLIKFSDAIEQIKESDAAARWGKTDPSSAVKLAADKARKLGYLAKRQVAAALNGRQVGLGDEFLATNKDHAVASVLRDIFSEKGMFRPDGKIDVAKFQELTQERGTAGYRDELNGILGNKGAADFIRNVAHRGGPPTSRDIQGQGLKGIVSRFFVHPTGVSAIGHVPMAGDAPIFSQIAGKTPYTIPPLPAELFAQLFGPAAARQAGVSDATP